MFLLSNFLINFISGDKTFRISFFKRIYFLKKDYTVFFPSFVFSGDS